MDVCTACSLIHILQQYIQKASAYDDNHSQPRSVEVWRSEAEASPFILNHEPEIYEEAQGPKEDLMHCWVGQKTKEKKNRVPNKMYKYCSRLKSWK